MGWFFSLCWTPAGRLRLCLRMKRWGHWSKAMCADPAKTTVQLSQQRVKSASDGSKRIIIKARKNIERWQDAFIPLCLLGWSECSLKLKPGTIWRVVKYFFSFTHSSRKHSHMQTHLTCQVVINMQSKVDNRPKQLMLSVCMLEKKKKTKALLLSEYVWVQFRKKEWKTQKTTKI